MWGWLHLSMGLKARGVVSWTEKLLAVERTMQILERLAWSATGLGVTEMASQLQLQKADVSRILSSLQAGNYVLQDPNTHRFRLSWPFVAMTLQYFDSVQVENAVVPVLQQIAGETGELVQFAVVQHDELIFVAKVEGVKPLRVASMLGQSAPLHATAVGKVWLASLPEEMALRILAKQGLAAVTERTITDPIQLLQELRRVREQGYAVSMEEVNPTVAGLAVPVYDLQQTVRAALVVTLPVFEATPTRLQHIHRLNEAGAKALEECISMF